MPVAPAPAPREPVAERTVITERPLPSLKELLPPPTWSSGSRDSGPVSLNTRDPIYVSYFNKIKQSIELQWEYPEVALRYGLQGRLSLEFAIAANGQLERLRILRSSGSQVLDDEALRAIKAAAPFPPIPPWIKANPLSISAFMEYHDNRLNYQFNR
jgi:TonB family protein